MESIHDEIIRHIAFFLPISDIANLYLVAHRYNKIMNDDYFWELKCKSDFNPTSHCIEFCTKDNSITRLKVDSGFDQMLWNHSWKDFYKYYYSHDYIVVIVNQGFYECMMQKGSNIQENIQHFKLLY